MAKNKTQDKPRKIKKNIKKIKKNACKSKANIKKQVKNAVIRSPNKSESVVNININDNIKTNESVLEWMKKYPELNQTFEYILYSNKYKHTITDVFNIVKMLVSKLEELEKNEVDQTNIFETMNLNNKIKGLVQSTAINLGHVVDQLNTNESKFLNFASNFKTPLKISNDFENVTDNIIPSFTSAPVVSEEPKEDSFVSKSVSKQPTPFKGIKTERLSSKLSTDIFGCNVSIVLSSDDECEEINNYDGNQKHSLQSEDPIKEEDLESYVIGSDLTDILSAHNYNDNDHDAISSPKKNQGITVPLLLSQRLTPVSSTKVRKAKQKISDETILEAIKSDRNLKKRLDKRKYIIGNVVKTLNLHAHEIVLEFDIENKKPLVTIPNELVKVLKKHQVNGIRFLWDTVFETVDKTNTTDGTGCILAHQMGIGKTLQIITLMYTILCHSSINIKTFLIICPSGLIYNWMDEIYKWLRDIDKSEIVKVYDLPKTNKLYNITNIATWKSKGGILILSYENFKSLVNCKQEDLREAFSHTLINPGPDVVILDEGHYIKNSNSVLLKSLTQIRTKRRIVLTGTPIQNSLKEYYTMVDFVKPNILGNFSDFSSMFIKPINSGQLVDSSDEDVQIMKQRTYVLHKLLDNTVHRIDDKNLKTLLTEKVEYTIEVNLTDFQQELYEKFLNYNKLSNDTSNVFLRYHAFELINLHPLTLHRLIHFKNGKQSEFGSVVSSNKFSKDLSWIKDYADDPRFFDAKQSNKIMYLMSMIDKCEKINEKMLCFVKSPLALDALEYFLQKDMNWTLGGKYYRMDGKTPLSIRNQMCEAFNNPNNSARLFILSLGTGVLGYNMVGANRVMLLSTSWNPSNDLQAIYRCLRFGQRKIVYVNRLLGRGTVEPKTYYRQISKLGIASSVVDLQHLSRKVSYEQINDLFTFDSSKQYYTQAPNTKDPILNHLIQFNIASISEIKEHDSMLVESIDKQMTLNEKRVIWTRFMSKGFGIKGLIFHIPSKKSKNTLTKINPQMINKVKQEFDNTSVFSNSSQHETHEVSAQNEIESHDSRFHSRLNVPMYPSLTGKHTKFVDTTENPYVLNTEFGKTNLDEKKLSNWKNNKPIQNQFKSFQIKNFNQHKKYPLKQYRPNLSLGIPNRVNMSDQNQQNPQHLNRNSTWYRNKQTSTYNNFHNRSGMY